MTYLLLGILLFFGVHCLSVVAGRWRDAMVARLGKGPWQGLYSLLSAVGLALMIYGYGLTRLDSPWAYAPPAWGRHAAMTLMLPVFVLLVAAYLPGALGRKLRHPMLIATVLWGLAHLLSNGRVADVLLFGSFTAWALLVLASHRWRSARPIPRLPAGRYNDAIAVLAGLALYAAFVLKLHKWVTGMPLMG